MVISILLTSFIAGATMYYLQVYGFYEQVNVEQAKGISLVNLSTQEPEKIQVANFQGIDANSSPIRFRACFEVNDPIDLLKEKYVMLNAATPRNAGRIGEDLSRGLATAFLGSKNFEYGIDRYVVVYPDGRGYAWNEINDCGEKLYDGSTKDQSCPSRLK